MNTYSYREFLAKTDDLNSEENRSLRNVVDGILKKAGYKTVFSSPEIKHELSLSVEIPNGICLVKFYGGYFVSVYHQNFHNNAATSVNIDASEALWYGEDGKLCDIPTWLAQAVLSVLDRMKNKEN